MNKLWDKLRAKDARGELNLIRMRLRNQKLSQEAEKGDTQVDEVPGATKTLKTTGKE